MLRIHVQAYVFLNTHIHVHIYVHVYKLCLTSVWVLM